MIVNIIEQSRTNWNWKLLQGHSQHWCTKVSTCKVHSRMLFNIKLALVIIIKKWFCTTSMKNKTSLDEYCENDCIREGVSYLCSSRRLKQKFRFHLYGYKLPQVLLKILHNYQSAVHSWFTISWKIQIYENDLLKFSEGIEYFPSVEQKSLCSFTLNSFIVNFLDV